MNQRGAKTSERALVVIPTYNEVENVPAIVPEILGQDPSIHVLIVDDNSPDGTGEVAQGLADGNERIHVLHREGKMGLGSAYIAGFRWAIERKYDFVFEMDADFSHDPDALPQFLHEIESHDLVLGSRYLNGVTVVNWPLSRLVLSLGANIYTRIVTGLPIKDSTGGFKCFRRHVLEALPLDKIQSDGYSFQIEVNFHCWKRGFRIKEIPILFVDRRVGTSKMSRHIIWEAVWMVWRLRFRSKKQLQIT